MSNAVSRDTAGEHAAAVYRLEKESEDLRRRIADLALEIIRLRALLEAFTKKP